MRKNLLISSLIILFTAFSFINDINAHTEATDTTFSSQEELPLDQVVSLDLSYVAVRDCVKGVEGDCVKGQLYSEEFIIQKIISHPNLEELDISGQNVSPRLMSVIHDNLPNLKKLTIKGSIRFVNNGILYSWETIDYQEISHEALQALFSNPLPHIQSPNKLQ